MTAHCQCAKWLQVVTLGDPKLVARIATDELDQQDARKPSRAGAVGNVVSAQAYVSDKEAGGLTVKGLMVFLRKLPFMHSLRELRVHGIGASPQNQHDVMRLLAAGLAALPGLQVCLLWLRQFDAMGSATASRHTMYKALARCSCFYARTRQAGQSL